MKTIKEMLEQSGRYAHNCVKHQTIVSIVLDGNFDSLRAGDVAQLGEIAAAEAMNVVLLKFGRLLGEDR